MTTTLSFQPGELITNVTVYRDQDGEYSSYKTIVGMVLNTDIGKSYGPFGVTTAYHHSFSGDGLLYFHGRAGVLPDVVGVQFGNC